MNIVNRDIQSLSYAIFMEEKKQEERLRDAMAKVEQVFSACLHAKSSDKNNLIDCLSKAYRDVYVFRYRPGNGIPSNNLEQIIARICYLYGWCLHQSNIDAACQLFKLSVAWQFAVLRILNSVPLPPFQTDLTLQLLAQNLICQDAAFSQLYELVFQTDIKGLAIRISLGGSERAYSIAVGLRWLGRTYLINEKFKSLEYLKLFEKIFNLARAVLMNIKTADSQWEIGQILYDSARFITPLMHPDDINKTLENFKAIEFYLQGEGKSVRAQILRTQIANLTMVALGKLKPLSSEEKTDCLRAQYEVTVRAVEIADSVEGFDLFLKILSYNNRARCALNCIKNGDPVAELKDIEGWMGEVLKFVEKIHGLHPLCPYFLLTAGFFALHQGNTADAMEHLKRSDLLAERYPESSKNAQVGAEELRRALLAIFE